MFNAVALAVAVDGVMMLMMMTMMKMLADNYLFLVRTPRPYINYKLYVHYKSHVVFCFIFIRFLFNDRNYLLIRRMCINIVQADVGVCV